MSRNFTFSIDEYYHLYNRGTDKRVIFIENGDYLRFLALLYLCNTVEAIHRSDFLHTTFIELMLVQRNETLVDIGAYCLMPNHFHILVHEKVENGISLFMQKVSTAYTMYFNKKYKRSGALFEGRFRAKHIDNDPYLKYMFSYIHLNPVKLIDSEWKENGIKDRIRAREYLDTFKYSSYLDYLLKDTRPQESILYKEGFPNYFNTATFDQEVNEWLSYTNHVKVQP